jgi:uncharacterized phage protein (TIGR02220 family)
LGRDPAVLFYTSDFLTGTSRFTDEQCGQYIRALCSQHQEGHFTKEELFAILKSYDSPVLRKFKQDVDGLFYNERMEIEINKRVSFCESRSHKGFSGRKPKSYDNHTNTTSESIGNHAENDNEDEDVNKNIDEIEPSVLVVREILDYLNKKLSTHYRSDVGGFISGRIRDGFTTDDFKRVIDKKYIQWSKDPKMCKFLRPKTLFSPEHFQEYLNELEFAGQARLSSNSGKNNQGKPGYDASGNALGAVAKPGEYEEGIITLDGVPDHR